MVVFFLVLGSAIVIVDTLWQNSNVKDWEDGNIAGEQNYSNFDLV
jgi:hypothetical protein